MQGSPLAHRLLLVAFLIAAYCTLSVVLQRNPRDTIALIPDGAMIGMASKTEPSHQVSCPVPLNSVAYEGYCPEEEVLSLGPTDPERELSGLVVNENDDPIQGAEVIIRIDPERGRGPFPRTAPLATIETDSMGRFTWQKVQRREAYAILVSHPNYQAAHLRNLARSEANALTSRITLKSGFCLKGQILCEPSAPPLFDLRVQIYELSGSGPSAEAVLRATVTPDAQGRFRSPPLVRGLKRIVASAQGCASEVIDRWNFAATADQALPTLSLRAGQAISGRIIDVDRRTPLARVTVRARLVGPKDLCARADDDTLALPRVRRAFVGQTPRIDPDLAQAVQAEDGSMRLDPVWPPEIASRAHTEFAVQSDELGSFRFDGLFEGSYAIWVSGEGAQSDIELLAAAGAKDLELPARAPAFLSGQVLAPDGTPIEDFVLACSETEDARLIAPLLREQVYHEDGIFQKAMRQGKLFVHVWAEGYEPVTCGPFALQSGEQQAGIRIALDRASQVTGRVTDSEGAGLAQAEVLLWSGPPAQGKIALSSVTAALHRMQRQLEGFRTTTDENGAYRFDGVPAGPWTVVARAQGCATCDQTGITVARGQEFKAPDIRLLPESSFEVQIPSADVPLILLVMDLERPDLAHEVPLDREGTRTIGRLGPGRYRIVAMPAAEELRDPHALMTAISFAPVVALQTGEQIKAPPVPLAISNRLAPLRGR